MQETATERSRKKCHAAARAAAGLFPAPVKPDGIQTAHDDRCPVFAAKGAGALLIDVDGHEYIDYALADGTLLLGHADDRIVAAIGKAVAKGYALGAPCEAETRLAELVLARLSSVDTIQWTCSAADATVLAVEIAREVTGRSAVIAFEGGSTVGDARLAPYNDVAALERRLNEGPDAIAAVLIEPVARRMGLVPAEEGFLPAVARLAKAHGALLIVDESVTAFRVGRGGAYALSEVMPDMVCLGPIISGGMPLGALAGRREIMDVAGSLVGGPDRARFHPDSIALAAGVTTMQAIGAEGFHEGLEQLAARLEEGLRAGAAEAGVAIHLTRSGGMIGLFFTDAPVRDLASAQKRDLSRTARFRSELEVRGVHLGASSFIELFVSAAHTEALIDRTVEAAHETFRLLGPVTP
jgi:glutamate-1-semialdehyde 2,1-aminomutase